MARFTQFYLFMCFSASLGLNSIRELGSKTAIACSFEKFELGTTWQVRAGTDFVNVTSCTFSTKVCVDFMPHQYRGEVVSVLEGFNANLMISSVRTTATEFRCLSKYGQAVNTLEVYARPSNPVCDPAELDSNKKNILFTCRARNVYPSINAFLNIKGVNLTRQDVISSHCSNEKPDNLALNTYVAECIWRISTEKLQPLTYKYYVKMFPIVSNTTGINVPYVVSEDYSFQMKSSKKHLWKIGQSYIVTFTFKGFHKEATVSVVSEEALLVLSKCNLTNETCVDTLPEQYQAHFTEIRDGYKGVLLIDSVKINETTFLIYNENGVSYDNGIIRFEVYAEPNNIVCDVVDVDYTKTNLLFRCTAENVYPAINASLQILGARVTHNDFLSSHCSNKEPATAEREPYTVECIWRLPATKLEPVMYKYNVKMVPLVPNTIDDDDVEPVVSRDFTLQLRSPQAVIDYRHCAVGPGELNGHLIPGTTASCRCVLETRGFPPGQARWYTVHSHLSVGHDNLADGSSTLLLYNKTLGQRYLCRADSTFKNPLTLDKIYTPVFDISNTGPDRHGFRTELVVGVTAGSAVLIIIVALVYWKWRNRNRFSLHTSSIVYNAHREAASTTNIYSK